MKNFVGFSLGNKGETSPLEKLGYLVNFLILLQYFHIFPFFSVRELSMCSRVLLY